MMEYEGYANFPTFVIARMILDDEDKLAIARKILSTPATYDFQWENLRTWVTEYVTFRMNYPRGYLADLVNYSLDLVMWHQVAEEIQRV